MSRLILLPTLLLLCADALAEQPVRISNEAMAVHRTDAVSPNRSAMMALQWGLKEEELERYQALMAGPLGTYSPNLDPLTALGIEARTEEERRRFALLQVEAEAARVEKLLVYQRAYDQAWKDRYPNVALINQPPLRGPLLINPAERKAVFVRYDCSECESQVRRLQSAGATFDLYVVDSGQDDQRIRQWAHKAGIKSSNVRDGSVTVNHDSGRWSSYAGFGELPAVLHKVNGKWMRQQ